MPDERYKVGSSISFRVPDNALGRRVVAILNRVGDLPDPDDPGNPDKNIGTSRLILEAIIGFGRQEWDDLPSNLLSQGDTPARLESLESVVRELTLAVRALGSRAALTSERSVPPSSDGIPDAVMENLINEAPKGRVLRR